MHICPISPRFAQPPRKSVAPLCALVLTLWSIFLTRSPGGPFAARHALPALALPRLPPNSMSAGHAKGIFASEARPRASLRCNN